MKRRSIKNALIKVQANCEFDWGSRPFWTYNFGDDNTQPANFNDINTVRTTPIGHFYDPTITLTSAGYGTNPHSGI